MTTSSVTFAEDTAEGFTNEAIPLECTFVLEGYGDPSTGYLGIYVDPGDGSGSQFYAWTQDAFFNDHDFNLTFGLTVFYLVPGVYTVEAALGGGGGLPGSSDTIEVTVTDEPVVEPPPTVEDVGPQFTLRSRRVALQALPHQVTSTHLGRPL